METNNDAGAGRPAATCSACGRPMKHVRNRDDAAVYCCLHDGCKNHELYTHLPLDDGPQILPLPDADGLWWQWYQSEWRLCEAAHSRIMGRWEYRWNNGAHWFRCHAGFFVRCEPPSCLPNAEVRHGAKDADPN